MRGARVHRTLTVADSGDRIVLFSWAADPAPLKRNLARVDEHGNVVWRAQLPDKAPNDCFVGLKRVGDRLLARTFSGWVVSLGFDGEQLSVAREAAVGAHHA